MSSPLFDRLTTTGTFELDGQSFEVENNVFIVGGATDVVVIDAPHSAEIIHAGLRGRRLVAIVATHGHNDHINAAARLRSMTGAPVLIHQEDLPLWRQLYGEDVDPDDFLEDGDVISSPGSSLRVLHTPGHTPGGCCLHDEKNALLFSGDTLFKGGPGATGRSWSDFPTIIESIRRRLLALDPATRVLPGHGDETTIGDEAPHLEEWIARGH